MEGGEGGGWVVWSTMGMLLPSLSLRFGMGVWMLAIFAVVGLC